jgi:hypothetical protein
MDAAARQPLAGIGRPKAGRGFIRRPHRREAGEAGTSWSLPVLTCVSGSATALAAGGNITEGPDHGHVEES